MDWKLRILGGAMVLDGQDVAVRFRSRSAFALLVYVSLHDHPVSRETAQSLLWPDSDADRQSQNFRRAVSDLRDVLEPDLSLRGTIIETTRDSIGLISCRLQADAAEFRSRATEGLSNSSESSLFEAFDLYLGLLWPDSHEEWIFAYREELEELYAQVVDDLSSRLLTDARTREAVRLGRLAVLRAPMREQVHAALIRAYAASGQMVEAIRQFETLEQMLDENWGEAPSARSRAALDTPVIASHSSVTPAPPQKVSTIGGAVHPNSHLYIERQADSTALNAIQSCESVVLLQGPRQVGKTSMLARCLAKTREQGHKIVLTDFQSLSTSQLVDEEKLYRALCDQLVRSLGLDLNLSELWNTWLGPNSNLDNVVRLALAEVDASVLWAMDEADRLFGHECGNDFFGLVRSWHNRRALEPAGPWSRLTVAIGYATEAHLFITDLNQSPFNIGVRLRLEDFNLKQVQELNHRMGARISAADIERVYALTHGQPYLTRRALDFLSAGGLIDELEKIATRDEGPFGEHLRRLGHVVSKDTSVMTAIGQMLSGKPIEDERVRSRLLSGGVAREAGSGTAFRVPIYGLYLTTAGFY